MLSSAVVAATLLAPAAAPPSPVELPTLHDKCDRQNKAARFRITLKREAELKDLVEWMMSVSCQKFIWAPGLRTKKVNIVAPEPVTLAEAYAAFYAALQTIGATVEPAGDYYKIVETQAVGTSDLPVYGPGAKVPNDDRYVTKVWRPPADRKDEAAQILEGLKTANGSVSVVGGVVLMTDTGTRIRRLERLLDDIGAAAAPHEKIHLYGVEHGDAPALLEVAKSVFAEAPTRLAARPKGKGKTKTKSQPVAEAGSGPTFTVDERTGTIIVVATDEAWRPIHRLLKELDVDQESHGTLHVIELEHADATEVEAVLTKLAGKPGDGQGKKKGGGGEPGSAVTGDVRVTAHQATQTLIVSASASDFAAVKRVVDKIDRRRRQLYIEVYLLEVRAETIREFGAGGHFGGGNTADGVGFVNSSPGGSNATLSADGSGSAALLSGLSAGVIGPALTGSGELLGLGRDLPAFGITLQALETQSDINIVAEPHLYASENEEATAEFGETVPVQAGITTVPGTQTTALSQVNDKEVTLKLSLTPHVADDETVTIDVVLSDTQLGQAEPSINSYRTLKRKLDVKKVIAHPGQPVVLGGLTREIEDIASSQVPGLGQIPVLGWLFKKRRRRKDKVSLLMIMVPHLIDTPDDARRVHERRLQERLEFVERYTAFKRKDLDTHVNYRKKSGLLAAVNLAAQRQERDAELTAAARADMASYRIETTIDPREPAKKGGSVTQH